MQITASQLKNNIGKYIGMVGEGDIVITKNGRQVAVLTSCSNSKIQAIHALRGVIPGGIDLTAARSERLGRYDTVD